MENVYTDIAQLMELEHVHDINKAVAGFVIALSYTQCFTICNSNPRDIIARLLFAFIDIGYVSLIVIKKKKENIYLISICNFSQNLD